MEYPKWFKEMKVNEIGKLEEFVDYKGDVARKVVNPSNPDQYVIIGWQNGIPCGCIVLESN